MEPAVYDFEVTQGDDYSLTVSFQDDSGPLDYHLLTFSGKVRPYPEAPTSVSFTVDATGAATGVVVFSLAGAQTLTLPLECTYDLQMSGTVPKFTFMSGIVSVPRVNTR